MSFSSLSSGQRITILLELLGGPKYAASITSAAARTKLLGKSVFQTGQQMQLAGRRTMFMTQTMYTLRRVTFFGTLALAGMAVSVAKLGYSYLSAMQQARVALSPVIKDQATLNGYLNQLFQISKYSPFVITDLAVAFRQLFAGLSGTGISAPQILTTIKSLTDLMSFTGKTGPGALQRVSLALQHMAFAGRLTGYAVNQLSRDGIPIMRILNEQFGITGDQLHNISKMGIPASKVLAAINKFAMNTPGVKNAALRLSMKTLPGLLQVARDSLSQLSGAFLKGSYSGAQGWLFNLVKPGGPLDKISKFSAQRGHSGSDTLLFGSRQLTGNNGLGRGLLLVLSVARNLGAVFAHVLVPAFVMGLHSLILFYPALVLLNTGLKFLNKHATVAKYIFAALAARFILVHSAILGVLAIQKLLIISTYGTVSATKALAAATWLWNLATVKPPFNYLKKLTLLERMVILLRTSMLSLAVASWSFTASLLANPVTWIVLAVVALTAGVVILYLKWKAFHDLVNNTFNWIKTQSPLVKAAIIIALGPIAWAAAAMYLLIKRFDQIKAIPKKV